MKKNRVIIIGSGLAGATIGRKLAENGFKVDIYEERKHIGGNVYDYKEKDYYIHKYGPHIFHTSNEDVWEFLSKFTKWIPFELRTRVLIEGEFYNCPFNLSTLKELFPKISQEDIDEMVGELEKTQVSIRELLNSKNELASKFGKFLWDNDYSKYTSKQWMIPIKDIDDSILDRVKINLNYYDRIHNDTHEALPSNGYTKMIYKMLKHRNIKTNINVINGIEQVINNLNKDVILIYTGAIDRLFNYKFGELSYIGLDFKYKEDIVRNYKKFDPCVDIYPDKIYKFTRITDYGVMYDTKEDFTVRAYEYPYYFNEDNKIMERYYPINKAEDKEIYSKYLSEVNKYDNLYLCGRLAEYKYYNMDEVVNSALKVAEEILNENR